MVSSACTAILYIPLIAAAAFLIGQVFQSPWYLVFLSSLFVVQVGLVGPAPLALGQFSRQCLDLVWNVLFACCGHHELEVTREWLYFGECVGRFGNFLNRRKVRRVPTPAIQQIIIFADSGQRTPTKEETSGAEPRPQPADGSTLAESSLPDKIDAV